jgi:hypothetical protein
VHGWPWAVALVALSIVVRNEPRRNIGAFLGSRPMGVDDDWPEARVKATMEAYSRILAYERERKERLQLYEANWSRNRLRVAR